MTRRISQVRLIHVVTRQRYVGVMDGGWTTVEVNRRVGAWQPVSTEGQSITLACDVYGCQAQAVFCLNDETERAQFARKARLRRAKRLGVSLIVWLAGVLLQLYGSWCLPLLIAGIALTSIGFLASVILLLMLVFGGRMPRYTVATSLGSSDIRHEVGVS